MFYIKTATYGAFLAHHYIMSSTISELKPLNPVLTIDNLDFSISIVTLQHEVYFAKHYESLTGVFEALHEKPELTVDLIWVLLIDKDFFDNSFEEFKSFIYNSKDLISEWSKDMSECFHQSVILSRPLIKNKKRYKELQEINNTQVESAVCYASYYDTIASRYGYSLEQFYTLTLRQIHILLKVIGDKQYEELEVQAALQGRKLKPRMVFADITEEQEEEQEEHALDTLKRLQQEYKDRQNGK